MPRNMRRAGSADRRSRPNGRMTASPSRSTTKGRAFPAPDRERVFDMFYRVRGGDRRRQGDRPRPRHQPRHPRGPWRHDPGGAAADGGSGTRIEIRLPLSDALGRQEAGRAGTPRHERPDHPDRRRRGADPQVPAHRAGGARLRGRRGGNGRQGVAQCRHRRARSRHPRPRPAGHRRQGGHPAHPRMVGGADPDPFGAAGGGREGRGARCRRQRLRRQAVRHRRTAGARAGAAAHGRRARRQRRAGDDRRRRRSPSISPATRCASPASRSS